MFEMLSYSQGTALAVASITIYDNGFDEEITSATQSGSIEFCTAVEELDCDLASIAMPFSVHSTTG